MSSCNVLWPIGLPGGFSAFGQYILKYLASRVLRPVSFALDMYVVSAFSHCSPPISSTSSRTTNRRFSLSPQDPFGLPPRFFLGGELEGLLSHSACFGCAGSHEDKRRQRWTSDSGHVPVFLKAACRRFCPLAKTPAGVFSRTHRATGRPPTLVKSAAD